MGLLDDGGPAFPHHEDCFDDDYAKHLRETTADGLSIRDYFAAKIVGGILTNTSLVSVLETRDSDKQGKEIAEASYTLADAMLKARKESATDVATNEGGP